MSRKKNIKDPYAEIVLRPLGESRAAIRNRAADLRANDILRRRMAIAELVDKMKEQDRKLEVELFKIRLQMEEDLEQYYRWERLQKNYQPY